MAKYDNYTDDEMPLLQHMKDIRSPDKGRFNKNTKTKI